MLYSQEEDLKFRRVLYAVSEVRNAISKLSALLDPSCSAGMMKRGVGKDEVS